MKSRFFALSRGPRMQIQIRTRGTNDGAAHGRSDRLNAQLTPNNAIYSHKRRPPPYSGIERRGRDTAAAAPKRHAFNGPSRAARARVAINTITSRRDRAGPDKRPEASGKIGRGQLSRIYRGGQRDSRADRKAAAAARTMRLGFYLAGLTERAGSYGLGTRWCRVCLKG